MRYGITLSTSAIFFVKSTGVLYQPLLLGSRNLFTSPSLSTRKKTKKTIVHSTITDQASPKISGNIDIKNTNRSEPLPSTKVTGTAAPEPNKIKHKVKRKEPRAQHSTWTLKAPSVRFERNLERKPGSDNKMHSYIQFITTPTSDTPGTALLLHFDDARYIIGNAHEGLQRASLQMGARIFKSKDFFLTGRTEWKSNGGLLGMILTLADAANASALSRADVKKSKLENKRKREEEEGPTRKRNLDANSGSSPSRATATPENIQPSDEDRTVRLHGGPNLTHTLATARSFVFRKGTPIKVFEHVGEKDVEDNAERDWEPTWSDARVQVWAMPISPSGVSGANGDLKPESSQKRSLGEFMRGEPPSQKEAFDQWSVHPAVPEGQGERNQQTRDFAVSEMFSSAWSHDNLVEMPLRNVKMPAALLVRDQVTKELRRYEGPTPDGTAPVPDINVLVRQAWPGALIDHLPSTKRSSVAMSYIIRNHKMRGKFKPAAAKERNVPPGPLWAALARGSSVQSNDGVTVTPDMVLEPSKEGSGVAVIDLPSSEYVHDLVHRSEWTAERVMSGVKAVIWMLGPGVVQDQTLIKFIESQPGVQHIISSPERCPNYLSMTSVASMAIRHNQIDPVRYATPVHSNAIPPASGDQSDHGDPLPQGLPNFCQSARRGLKLKLEPKFGVTEEAVVDFLNTAVVVRETSEDVLRLSQAARKEISSPAVQAETLSQNLPSPDAEIICLGTGSALPSQHRNVSATLLRVPGCGSYLMDCGENTLGQLKRMYTAPQLAEILQDLKLIWISHLHADHHLGLTSVIRAWYEEVHGKDEVKRRRPMLTEQMLDTAKLLQEGRRLFVVGHEHMRRWLEEYSSVEDFGYDQIVPLVSYPINIRAIDVSSLEWNGVNVGFNVAKDPKLRAAIRSATGLANLVSCHVSHCYGAQAVSLTFPTGFKFSYSGDCRPSQAFAEIGKHSTVLLHEATFDDELQSDAIAKKHSTTSEAIGVGAAMGARRVILTHFSQRYQKIPSMSALDAGSIKFEDAEDVDDPLEDTIQPIEESTHLVKSKAEVDSILDVLDDVSSQAQTEPHPQTQSPQHVGPPGPPGPPAASSANTLAQIVASNINPTPRPQLSDMKIAVAFDYMRVKVGEIMHLEKFTPALRELYKETDDEVRETKAAKEAFSDDENDVLKEEQGGGTVEKTGGSPEKRTKEEKAEQARKGQVKAARKKQESREKWEKEKGEKSKVGGGGGSVGAAGEGVMEGVEATEPAVEKLRAVQ